MAALVTADTVRTEKQKVFVYGTLKEGFPNHLNHLQHSRKLGQAKIEGIMFHLGGFPAVNLSDKFSSIYGEVYLCDWDTVLSMDRLEGHPGFYRRVEIAIPQYTKAWVYIMPAERCNHLDFVIPGGVWKGRDTPKAMWEGWGRGIRAGTWEAHDGSIRVGSGDKTSPFVLKKNGASGEYDLINSKTGEVIGKGYKTLSDIITKAKGTRPTVTLPKQNPAVETKDNYNPPGKQLVVLPSDNPEVKQETKPDPRPNQAAELLGLKVSAA